MPDGRAQRAMTNDTTDRSCFVCLWARFRPDGVTICSDAGVSVDSEAIWAEDCDGFVDVGAEADRLRD